MKYFLLLGFFFLVSCTSSTGILEIGPDTYMISGGGVLTGSTSGNNTIAKKKAFGEAAKYCTKQGKHVLVSNTDMQTTVYGSTADVIFKCLTEDDYQYQRPNYERSPDVLIENRAR